MAKLKLEIVQEPAFFSVEEEAMLNLMRTADCLQRAFQRRIRDWGVTSTQYNVLRILRGAHPNGLTCSAIGGRMITAEPDITRLLNRLKAVGWIEQERDKQDRRVVWTRITPSGLELLKRMDDTVRQFPSELLGHMSQQDLSELVRLLETAREPAQESVQESGQAISTRECCPLAKCGETA